MSAKKRLASIAMVHCQLGPVVVEWHNEVGCYYARIKGATFHDPDAEGSGYPLRIGGSTPNNAVRALHDKIKLECGKFNSYVTKKGEAFEYRFKNGKWHTSLAS